MVNPLKTELNPQCKSQLAKLFCGVFKLFEKPEYFENQAGEICKIKAFCGEENRD
jgi:hypothetical protein